MRVLVTGAAGFVGTAVVARLASEHTVRAVDVAPVAAAPGVEPLVGDLADWDVARAAVADIDAIVHLATGGVRPGTTPPGMVSDALGTTVALLEAARGGALRRLVLMSSGAVLTGHPRGTRIGPGTPVAYRGLYALTKHLQEVTVTRYAEELGIVAPILRPWVVVDADRRRLRDGTPMDPALDPLDHNGAWGWVERRDLADACALALVAPMTGAPVIHLMANPLGRALLDTTAADALGWRPRFPFLDAVPPGTDVPDPPAPSEVRS